MIDKRLRARFSGMVQGVGFRFTAERIARRFKITGYVKNLANGKVELIVEGNEEVLKDFFAEVCKAMSHYIQDTDVEWSNHEHAFKHFGITF